MRTDRNESLLADGLEEVVGGGLTEEELQQEKSFYKNDIEHYPREYHNKRHRSCRGGILRYSRDWKKDEGLEFALYECSWCGTIFFLKEN